MPAALFKSDYAKIYFSMSLDFFHATRRLRYDAAIIFADTRLRTMMMP